MAVQKSRKTNRRTKQKRHYNFRIERKNIITCNNCDSLKINHQMCKCGYYKGKQILSVKAAKN